MPFTVREVTSNGSEIGVDLNRNFGFHYGEDPELNNPCTEDFRGPTAFSEPESQAIKNLVSTQPFSLAFNFHTYGNLWLYPFAYFRSAHARFPNMETKTENFYESLRPQIAGVSQAGYKTVFQSLGYWSEGEVSDWMLGEKGIVSFSPELGTNDSETQTFAIPKEYIFETFQQSIGVLELILSKSVFQIADTFFAFDNNGHLNIRLDNNLPAPLANATIRIGSSPGVLGFLQTIKFAHSLEQPSEVPFIIDPTLSEVIVSLPKLHKLKNYEFLLQFSSPMPQNMRFELSLDIADATGAVVWSTTFIHSAAHPFFHVAVIVVFFSLAIASSLLFLLALTFVRRKPRAHLTTELAPQSA